MAPEILNNEKYDNECDLWSLGVLIYKLYTRQFPYIGNVEKAILDNIKNIGLKILDNIKPTDRKLKDLLSKLLISNPKKRITWENYFQHCFFNDNIDLSPETKCIIF